MDRYISRLISAVVVFVVVIGFGGGDVWWCFCNMCNMLFISANSSTKHHSTSFTSNMNLYPLFNARVVPSTLRPIGFFVAVVVVVSNFVQHNNRTLRKPRTHFEMATVKRLLLLTRASGLYNQQHGSTTNRAELPDSPFALECLLHYIEC